MAVVTYPSQSKNNCPGSHLKWNTTLKFLQTCPVVEEMLGEGEDHRKHMFIAPGSCMPIAPEVISKVHQKQCSGTNCEKHLNK
jgi:hypothetical protein